MYFAMGMVCLQVLYNRKRKDYQDRVARAKSLMQQSRSIPEEGP
jgi:hypothetical protein